MAKSLENHALLSPQAKLLRSEELTAHRQVAESLLLTSDLQAPGALAAPGAADQYETALVLQVNFQVAAGVEGYLMQQARRGARHLIYRGTNRLSHVNRQSLEMIRALKIAAGVL